ncbi:glycoside hydrolase family 3 protein [Subtercola lobariae]|uniref:Sugar hydrolase n=1 Tax=Subtercola lobariae TaxID=1588641 RepID=A0A917EZK2_9MICO|nr:glycoside hydrolase family 3 protein [Subtercola lobariae]GGF29468.1 sugar hydrolase [Subtercola lobariae]
MIEQTQHDSRRRSVLATLLPGFEGITLPTWLSARLAEGLGGVCLFGENVESLPQLAALTSAIREANPHAIIAIDEEGGDVTRLFYDIGSPYPGNAVLGRLDDLAQTEAVARAVGVALRGAGVNLAFAPDVDVNSNPNNPVIGVRSFGADAELVARHSAAWVHGLQSTGVAASAKHFPGHGDTAADSHRSLPVVDVPLEVLRARELVPFASAIAAEVRTIMTSHILLPHLDSEHPATLSSRILQGLLRTELGFDGVVVSDALDMAGASGSIGIPEAAVQALASGCDLLCIGTKNTDAQLAEVERALLAALDDGRLTGTRLGDAATAVRSLGAELAEAAVRPELAASAVRPESAESAVRPESAESAEAPESTDPRTATHLPEPARIAATFELNSEARAWLQNGPPDVVVRLHTVPNEAIGTVPWGPFAHLDEQAELREHANLRQHATAHDPHYAQFTPDAWHAANVITVTEKSAGPLKKLAADPDFTGSRIVVIGTANHLTPWVTRLIDRLRRSNSVLVIDMGWPAPDRRYADIATFGASRLVGEALLSLFAASNDATRTIMQHTHTYEGVVR